MPITHLCFVVERNSEQGFFELVEFDYRTERAGTYSNWIHLDRNQEKLNKSMATQFFTTIARADLETICFLFHCHKKTQLQNCLRAQRARCYIYAPNIKITCLAHGLLLDCQQRNYKMFSGSNSKLLQYALCFFYFYVVTCYPNKEQLQNGFTA